MQRDVLLAAILGAHGLKGEVRVKTFTEAPEKLGAYGPLHAKDGRLFTLEALRAVRDGEAVAAFAEIRGRDAAEALKGTELFVKRGSFPETSSGEFYHADLVGLDAEDGEGRHIGKVLSVQNYGAGDVLAIATDSGDEILIAFTRDNVPKIDVPGGRLIVAVPDEVDDGSEKEPE
jgi:16S rRNA processing protein RimM